VTALNQAGEEAAMEFQDVVRRRRMVRTYEDRPVPRETLDRIVANCLRAPSAGFSQGTVYLVLDTPEDIERFRESVTPDEHKENWLAANIDAPALIVVLSNKDAYLDRYAEGDKGFTDRSDAWWTAPYWDIDAGMGALLGLLTAVDEGLGACFFGMEINRVQHFRTAFDVPDRFHPIGIVSLGYGAEPPRDFSSRRKPKGSLVYFGRFGS
jgi:nitroreductase